MHILQWEEVRKDENGLPEIMLLWYIWIKSKIDKWRIKRTALESVIVSQSITRSHSLSVSAPGHAASCDLAISTSGHAASRDQAIA